MFESGDISGSGVPRGDLSLLFSVATTDNGRPLAPAEPREVGRCCHDSVPVRPNELELDCDADVVGLSVGRSTPSNNRFLALGTYCTGSGPLPAFEAIFKLEFSRVGSDSGNCSLDVCIFRDNLGDSLVAYTEDGVLMFEGESFVGDIDLARSVSRSISRRHNRRA